MSRPAASRIDPSVSHAERRDPRRQRQFDRISVIDRGEGPGDTGPGQPLGRAMAGNPRQSPAGRPKTRVSQPETDDHRFAAGEGTATAMIPEINPIPNQGRSGPSGTRQAGTETGLTAKGAGSAARPNGCGAITSALRVRACESGPRFSKKTWSFSICRTWGVVRAEMARRRSGFTRLLIFVAETFPGQWPGQVSRGGRKGRLGAPR